VTRVAQAVAIGLGTGSIYTLLALGYVIIYKTTKVLSFAQPALMLTGAVAVSYLATTYGLPFPVAVLIGMVLVAGLGLVIERTALRPMIGKPIFTVAIITIGIDILLRTIVNRFIGNTIRQVGDPFGISTVQLGGVFLQYRYVAMLVTAAIVVTGLLVFFRRSRTGLAMRAAAFDQETALAQGISIGRVFALSWLIAGALATLAGVMVGAGASIDQLSWTVALKALPAIIIGGLDSIEGAIVGGLAVGVFEAFVFTYQPTVAPWLGQNFSVVSPYVLLLIVLLVRPYGLFGTPEVERV